MNKILATSVLFLVSFLNTFSVIGQDLNYDKMEKERVKESLVYQLGDGIRKIKDFLENNLSSTDDPFVELNYYLLRVLIVADNYGYEDLPEAVELRRLAGELLVFSTDFTKKKIKEYYKKPYDHEAEEQILHLITEAESATWYLRKQNEETLFYVLELEVISWGEEQRRSTYNEKKGAILRYLKEQLGREESNGK